MKSSQILVAGLAAILGSSATDCLPQDDTNDVITIKIEETKAARSTAPLNPYISETNGISYCALHHVRLREDGVPIVYGLVKFDKDFRKVRDEFFPNAFDVSYGGCVPMPVISSNLTVSSSIATNTIVKYCRMCRDSKKKWESEHPAE